MVVPVWLPVLFLALLIPVALGLVCRRRLASTLRVLRALPDANEDFIFF